MKPLHLYISARKHTEIGRLLKKHGLRITQADFRVYPKIVYIDRITRRKGEPALWEAPCCYGSIRRTKKAIKKFLRAYDKTGLICIKRNGYEG